MYVKDCFDQDPPFRYIIRNHYDYTTLSYNDVKKIKLEEYDKGPIIISKIEKWKRKVVNRQTDRKTKLRLLHPNVYHSLITFFSFSRFKDRPHNKVDYDLSWDGIGGVDRKLNNYLKSINLQKIMRISFI